MGSPRTGPAGHARDQRRVNQEPPPVGHATELRTDMGNARRFSRLHGRNFKYTAAHGWLVWEAGRWLPDDTGARMRAARATVETIWADANGAADPDEMQKIAKFALRSQAEARLKAIVNLAQSERPIVCRPDAFDRSSWLLTVKNGTVDLRNGQLRPHRREDMITGYVNIAYSPEAKCPRFLQFLSELFPGDDDLVQYIQRAIGYSLTGITTEQVFFLLHGTGANGKSTLLEMFRTITGGYARQASFESFLTQRYPGVRTDIARLAGARLVTATEGDAGRRLSESVIKVLTGGDIITARKLYRDEFEFLPVFKIWLGTNHKPVITGMDYAMWRRIQLIPFTERFEKDRRDPDLKEELLREAPGILAWAVEGTQEWKDRGLDPPTAVLAATADYKQEEDFMGEFFSDRCTMGEGFITSAAELYTAYETWAERNGGPTLSRQKLGRLLGSRPEGLTRVTNGSVRSWKGIGLTAEDRHGD